MKQKLSTLFVITIITIIIAAQRQIPAGASGYTVYLPLSLYNLTSTKIVSVATNGEIGNGRSQLPAISGDGRYIAFQSDANNLVAGDTNDSTDVFVHDSATGQTIRASQTSDGNGVNGFSIAPSISGDGRYVVFEAQFPITSNDTNFQPDIFIHDLQTRQTNLISLTPNGVSGNGESITADISGDGRYVAYESIANNLVGDDTNGFRDIFVYDRQNGQTERVSIASDGTQANGYSYAPSVSDDGRYVAFESFATNLTNHSDTNSAQDIFVHDRQTGQTILASVSLSNTTGSTESRYAAISGDGQTVAFYSTASNLVNTPTYLMGDVFVYGLQTGQVTLVSIGWDGTAGGNASSSHPSISENGRYVAFYSLASNLVNFTIFDRVFVRDMQLSETSVASVASDGGMGNSWSRNGSISANGQFVAFESDASNMVVGDTNFVWDIFVRDRGPLP